MKLVNKEIYLKDLYRYFSREQEQIFANGSLFA